MSQLFPRLVGPPQPSSKTAELEKAVGKTIDSVEFGEVERHAELHQSEGMIFHFTDGSKMALRIGSNVQNLVSEFTGLDPQSMHTDLMVFWGR